MHVQQDILQQLNALLQGDSRRTTDAGELLSDVMLPRWQQVLTHYSWRWIARAALHPYQEPRWPGFGFFHLCIRRRPSRLLRLRCQQL